MPRRNGARRNSVKFSNEKGAKTLSFTLALKRFKAMLTEQMRCVVKTLIISLFGIISMSSAAFAQDPQPRVGRDEAAKYFQVSEPQEYKTENGSSRSAGPDDHYLAVSFSKYMASQSYDWGDNGQEDDVGGNSFGVTYRVNEWHNSMDLNLRLDYSEYNLAGGRPTKLSFLPLLTFPDSASRFPLYFGIGAGLGVFFKQIDGKSPISFDYQLVAGARFFDVFENTGFFIEAGLKNHILIVSSGQLNGTFLAAGMVFTF
jgi:hypothetical protein